MTTEATDEALGLFIPGLVDIEDSRQIAWKAIGQCPSEDLSIDEQESLAQTFLNLTNLLTQMHAMAVDDDVSANDFFQFATDTLDEMGIKSNWTGFAELPDDDDDEDSLVCAECEEEVEDGDDQSRGPLTLCSTCAEAYDDGDEDDDEDGDGDDNGMEVEH